MKSSNILPVLLHTVILLVIQFVLLVGLSIPVFDRYTAAAFVYPLIIILFPLNTPRSALLIVGFVIGLTIDFFYNSPGVHAGALVFTAFIRPFILKSVEPRGGYRTGNLPTIVNYGFNWFLIYSASLLFIHLLIYYALDVFTFVFIDKIIVNSILSFVVSYVIMLLYQVSVRQ